MKKKHLFTVLTLLVLLASLLPLFWIAFYNHPAADDFSFSAAVANVRGEGFLACLFAALKQIKRFYFGWQGTYSAVFLMALSPSVLSEGLYAAVPFFLIILLSLATVLLFKTVLGGFFHAKRSEWLPVSLVTVLLSTELLPSAVQGFYWYNGSVYYCFFYSLALIDFCMMALYLKSGKGRYAWLGLVLAIIIGGGNYVTVLTLSLILGLAVLFTFVLKHPKKWPLVIHLLVLLVGFFVSIIAPGNAVRQAQFPDSPGVFEAILLSFKLAFFYLKEWATLPLLFSLLFAVPFFMKIAERSLFRFRLPLLVTLFSFCLFAAGFAPPTYAMGHEGGGRLLNILYFSYLLFWFLNVFYWCGWLSEILQKRLNDFSPSSLFGASYVSLALIVVSLIFSPKASLNLSVESLKSGEAQRYHREINERILLYENPAVKDPAVAPLTARPEILFFEDITQDPENWKNVSVSNFYQKNTVRLTEDYTD